MGANQAKDYWQPDEKHPNCIKCKSPFTLSRRRHHCRSCGGVFCASCCRRKTTVPSRGIHTEVRACDTCYLSIVAPSGSPSFGNTQGGGTAVQSIPRGSPLGLGPPGNADANGASPQAVENALPPVRAGTAHQTKADQIAGSVVYLENPTYNLEYDIDPDDYDQDINLAPARGELERAPMPATAHVDVDAAKVLAILSDDSRSAADRKLAVALNDAVTNAIDDANTAMHELVRGLTSEYTPTLLPIAA